MRNESELVVFPVNDSCRRFLEQTRFTFLSTTEANVSESTNTPSGADPETGDALCALSTTALATKDD